jgi:glycosyltransferase involved in cell wall biosynthesis
MKDNHKVVAFFVPFFNLEKHIGNYRVNRFLRFLHQEGYQIIVFSMGKKEVVKYAWGVNYKQESFILSTLEKLLKIGERFYPIKILYVLLKTFLKIILVPDEERLWANKISNSKWVLNIVKNVKFVFSSSPLESAHVASFQAASKHNIPLIVDLRDGWLDEPLQMNFMSKFTLRNKYEASLEKKIYEYASKIFVTSANWKKLLDERIPTISTKTLIITNAYPNHYSAIEKIKKDQEYSNQISLLYTGRLVGSRQKRKASFLFVPFIMTKGNNQYSISIKIVGDLRREDKAELVKIQSGDNNFEVSTSNYVPPSELSNLLESAHGLLLLTVSLNVIPAKFFEYILSKKPVLAITNKFSSVWELSKELPQFFVYELDGDAKKNDQIFGEFLNACNTGNYEFNIPTQYSEEYIKVKFCENI